jgi:hypothetical protein
VPLSRRRFVELSFTALAAFHPLMRVRLRVSVVLPAARADLLDGVMLGVDEARHTAALVGSSIQMVRETVDDLAAGAGDTLSAVIGGHDAGSLRALAARTRGAVPLLNVAAPDDDLRASHCGDAVFHIAPSEALLSRAAEAAGAGAGGNRVAVWHPTLFRYGAEQLNDRYRARHRGSGGMSADAWCGWMGMKVLADSALRSRAATNAELVSWMSSSRARFDGHKGSALTFDARRQLRHPLYVVSSEGKVVSEVAAMGDQEACA